MPRISLLPKDKKFSVLIEQSAENVAKVAQQYNDLLRVWENVKERVDIINDLEHDGDAIKHQIMSALRRSFIVPFDREDIAQLSQSLDEVVDFTHSAADSLLIFRIEKPTPEALELAGVLLLAALEVRSGVCEVFGRIEQQMFLKRCEQIHDLENRADRIYRLAVAGLFTKSDDPNFVIKWREVYKHMETAINKCEVIANVLEGIALKYG